MSSVLVVGSDPTFVRTTFTKKLGNHGVDVAAHWDWASRPGSKLPAGCSGVIVIAPEATGHLARAAREMAGEEGVPCVEITRQFSQGLPVLRKVGLVENGTGHTEPENSGPTEADLFNTALVYLRKERMKAREATFSEVKGVITRVYGPSVSFQRKTYNQAVDACRKRVETPEQFEQAIMWASLLIEDRPEKEDAAIVEAIKADYNDHNLRDKTLVKAVKQARDTLLAKWQTHWRYLTDKERADQRKMKLDWCIRYMLENVEEGDTDEPLLPTYKEIQDMAREVFGSAFSDAITKEARDRVLAELLEEPDVVDQAVWHSPGRSWRA
jgi:hypothetical protein